MDIYRWFFKNGTCPDDSSLLENGLIAWLSSLNWKGGEQAVVHAFSLANDSVIVLDDLERSIDPAQHLSLINRLSEHYGIRVVVVYNPDEVDTNEGEGKKKEFHRQKEKAIRYSYSFMADTSDIVNLVLEQSATSGLAGEFFQRQKDALVRHFIHLHKQFPAGINLRVLQMAIEQFLRLYDYKNSREKGDTEGRYDAYFAGYSEKEIDARFLHQFKLLFAIACQFHVLNIRNATGSVDALRSLDNSLYSFLFVNEKRKTEQEIAQKYIVQFFDQEFDGGTDGRIYWNKHLESYIQSGNMDFSCYYESAFPGITLAGKEGQDARLFDVLNWDWILRCDDEGFANAVDGLWNAIEQGRVTDCAVFIKAANLFLIFSKDKLISKSFTEVEDLFISQVENVDLSSNDWKNSWSMKNHEAFSTMRHFAEGRILEILQRLADHLRRRAMASLNCQLQDEIITCINNKDQEGLIDRMGRTGKTDSQLCIFNEESFAQFCQILTAVDTRFIHSIGLAFGCRWKYYCEYINQYPKDELPYYPLMLDIVTMLQADCNNRPLRRYNFKYLWNTLSRICSAIEANSQNAMDVNNNTCTIESATDQSDPSKPV